MITEFVPLLKTDDTRKPGCAIFLSGSGSNAEKVIEYQRHLDEASFDVKVLVTDAPKSSRAFEIGKAFDIPVVAVGLKDFYRSKGLETTSLATEEGRRVRNEWTDEVRRQIKPYGVDFGLLAGFVPLCNIAGDFPCLNVHPGDLTVEDDDGNRLLVGLHTLPVERAILMGQDHLRSSVILAEPFTGSGENMDDGIILGVSDSVPLDLLGHTLQDLKACAAARPAKRPLGGWDDILGEVAKHNQNLLKEQGDWMVFPVVAHEFAQNYFVMSDQGQLFYKMSKYIPVETVVYGKAFKEIVFTFE